MIRWFYRTCNRNWWQIPTILCAIAAILVVVLLLQGCGARPLAESPPVAPGVGDQLRALGAGFITWGGVSIGLGILIWVISLRFPGVGIFASLAASTGAGAIAFGAAFTWLAMYLWLVLLVCLAAALAVAWYHRNDLRRWYHRWLGAKTPVPKQ